MSVQIGKPCMRLGNPEMARILGEAMDSRSRLKDDAAEIDLWGKSKAQLPDTAVFVLAHEIYFQIDYFDQVIWFNRTDHRDELCVWTEPFTTLRSTLGNVARKDRGQVIMSCGQSASRVFSLPREGSFDASLVQLLGYFFYTAAGSGLRGMKHLAATGYLSSARYRLLLKEKEAADQRERDRHEAMCRTAKENETEIIQVARELNLYPEPAGTGPVQWYAKCPGTQHRLMITTSANQFGCGYCKVKGGVDQLRAFAEERLRRSRRA